MVVRVSYKALSQTQLQCTVVKHFDRNREDTASSFADAILLDLFQLHKRSIAILWMEEDDRFSMSTNLWFVSKSSDFV